MKERELKTKQDEVKIKQLRAKCTHLEALILQKTNEVTDWKLKWERRDAQDDKYTIQNRQEFEQHFGVKTQPKDDKYVNFMRMYNMQSEKLRKDNQLLREQVASLQSENGQERPNESVIT